MTPTQPQFNPLAPSRSPLVSLSPRPLVSAPPSSLRPHPSAFTTVELLVAIGIIVILAGIAVWGIAGAGGSARVKATRITLENCRNMLAELKTRRQPSQFYADNNTVVAGDSTAGGPADFFNMALPAPADSLQRDTARFNSDIVLNTQILIRMLRGIPANKSSLANIPTDQLLKTPPAGTAVKLTTGGDGTIDPPLILDAWGNPIVFVPKGGLIVDIKGVGKRRITSTGAEPSVGGFGTTLPPTPANAQPFFASAGPDGILLTGDDNVYSFEN